MMDTRLLVVGSRHHLRRIEDLLKIIFSVDKTNMASYYNHLDKYTLPLYSSSSIWKATKQNKSQQPISKKER